MKISKTINIQNIESLSYSTSGYLKTLDAEYTVPNMIIKYYCIRSLSTEPKLYKPKGILILDSEMEIHLDAGTFCEGCILSQIILRNKNLEVNLTAYCINLYGTGKIRAMFTKDSSSVQSNLELKKLFELYDINYLTIINGE